MARYPKIRRKDLRKPDEFITLTHSLVEFARANARAVTAGAIAAALVVATISGLAFWHNMRQSAANVAFVDARRLLVAENFPQAEAAFERIADKYSHTSYARLSLLYAGDSALGAGNYQAAADLYQRFLATAPNAAYLRQEALVRLGRAQAALGKHDLASRTYNQARALNGPFAADALLGSARAAEAIGDKSKAAALYRQFIKEYPNSDLATPIQSKLARLQTAEAPPAAPAS